MSRGMLFAPNSAPWGPSSDAAGLGSTRKETLGPGLDFYRFWKDFGAAISMFLANFGPTIVFFDMRVCRSRFLKILVSEYGRLRLQNQVFGVEGIAKTSFSHMSDYVDFGVIFTWFSMALGPILMTSGGLGPGLKHHDSR